ncbi:MAG: lipid-transfer protein [Gammaproteobacteria bacterium]|nr:lipid-transfer protein [Gammaproteobacteria bacterium]
MTTHINVIGVGMTVFKTPKHSDPYPVMGSAAIRAALEDAGIAYVAIEQAYAAYVYGDSCSGHRVVYEAGLTGIPIFNVNSNCSSGSSALYLARQALLSGAAECVLAVGFEQMSPGALNEAWQDRPTPLERFLEVAKKKLGDSTVPMAPRLFGAASREYVETYGMKPATLASIPVKARRHAAHNPRAVFTEPLTVEQVLASPSVCDPLTRFQCCPPTCGAAAAVLCTDEFAKRHGIKPGVRIVGQALVTDMPTSFADSAMDAVGRDMGRQAATKAYAQAGIGPVDIDVVELHDCFSINEVLAYEALGLCAEGGAAEFIERGDNTYGGRYVTNPSGGLISKGHPLGATGLAQCFELVTQLRGRAERRQVDGARVGVAHNIGLGGACVVSVYSHV